MKDFFVFLAFVCVWPGTMFLVGIIGESRLLPVGVCQSRAFIPGDLIIPVMAFAIYREYKKGFVFPRLGFAWLALAIVVIVPIGIKLWQADVTWYRPRARYSPTKIWHNLGGYILIPIAIATNVLAIGAETVRGRYKPDWLDVGIFLYALALYFCCLATDGLANPGDVDIRHPEDWKPIWVTISEKFNRSA